MDNSAGIFLNGETGIILVAIIGFFLFLAFFVHSYLPFQEERNYIKMEMARALEEEEYYYWKSELKRLYISKIPIIGSIVRQKYNR